MKKISLAAIAFLTLARIFSPAAAQTDGATNIDASVVSPFMAWVEHYTGVKVPSLPRVIASHKLLAKAVGGLQDQSAARQSVAAYLPGLVILDDRDWDPDDPIQQSILVHELVHHDQLFMNAGLACHEDMERQAYTLQNKWLTDHGLAPFTGDSPNEMVLVCPVVRPQNSRNGTP